MVEDRESGYLLSAVNCYFMCQVMLRPAKGVSKVFQPLFAWPTGTSTVQHAVDSERADCMPAAGSLTGALVCEHRSLHAWLHAACTANQQHALSEPDLLQPIAPAS